LSAAARCPGCCGGSPARAFFGEEELAKGMASHVLERFAPGA
jgi:hypothetical protein